MLKRQSLTTLALLITMFGCQKETEAEETDTEESTMESTEETESDAEWEELDEDGSSAEDEDDPWDDKEDEDYDDTGKESGNCPEEVAEGVACEGGWEETLCTDENGEMWWCDEGAWTSEKDE